MPLQSVVHYCNLIFDTKNSANPKRTKTRVISVLGFAIAGFSSYRVMKCKGVVSVTFYKVRGHISSSLHHTPYIYPFHPFTKTGKFSTNLSSLKRKPCSDHNDQELQPSVL